jgi:hypothetical protein
MKKPASKKSALTPAEEIRFLAVRTKAAEDYAETTKHLARVAKRKLKNARRTFKLARKVARRARKEAAKLRKALAAATKRAAPSRSKAAKPKKPFKARTGSSTAKKVVARNKKHAGNRAVLRKKKNSQAKRSALSTVKKKPFVKPVFKKTARVESISSAPDKVSPTDSSIAIASSEFSPPASDGGGAVDSQDF